MQEESHSVELKASHKPSRTPPPPFLYNDEGERQEQRARQSTAAARSRGSQETEMTRPVESLRDRFALTRVFAVVLMSCWREAQVQG